MPDNRRPDSMPGLPDAPAAADPPGRWRVLVAAFLGWMLDGYDFTMLTLVLVDIQRDLSMAGAAAGALGTVTLVTRLVGGAAVGVAADRWGRKLPLMLSIAWFSLFSLLSGFSTSFAMLFALRALFGLGMGGEWAAGMPLVLEHCPARLRGIVSGLVQSAYSWGFILAAAVFHYVHPLFPASSSLGWRSMLWSGALPAIVVLWMRAGVPESPVWLARQGQAALGHGRVSATWTRGLLVRAARATLILGALMFAYQSMSYWYATFLRQQGVAPLGPLVALNVGGICGAILCGMLADSRMGRRGTITAAVAASIACVPLFLDVSTTWGSWTGPLLMGLTGAGVLGVSPSLVAAQFPADVRSTGSGIVYHTAASLGAIAPYLLGVMQDRAWSLQAAMAASIAIAGLVAILLVWVGRSGIDEDYEAVR